MLAVKETQRRIREEVRRELGLPTAPPAPSPSLSPPTNSADFAPPSPPPQLKRDRVLAAAEQDDVDALRQLAAESGGFETSELRRAAWPVLLRCDRKGKQRALDEDEASPAEALASLPVRDHERQVKLDIARSLVNYPKDVKDENREALRERLETAILTVLRRHPALQYFQGYHDIVSVLLLTLDDDDLLVSVAERLSLHHIRDSIGAGLEPTLGYLKLVHRLIRQVDPELHSAVNQAASMPFFALSWALTLLSHDLESVSVIARLFDFLLARNPAMIVYLVVAILLTKRDDIVSVAAEHSHDDPAIIHSALSQLPTIVLDFPPPPSFPSPPITPTLPSSLGNEHGKLSPSAETEYTDEDLMSSASLAGSSSTSALTDLTLSPTLTASTSPTDLSESLTSHSEASPSASGLRQRRGHGRAFSLADSFGSSSSFGMNDYYGEHDDSLHALDDSMLADPDCDVGLPSSSSFSSLGGHRRSSTSRTPSPPRTPPAAAQVLRTEALASSSPIPPPRLVRADDLIQKALELWEAVPLSSLPSSSSSSDEPPSLRAEDVLGPSSCVFTYPRSQEGTLSDEEAEEIVAEGGEAVVRPGALLPDPTPAGEGEQEGEEGEADDYEVVEKPGSGGGRGARKVRRKSTLGGGGGAVRLNLGPHGWLVLGGAAVATAAVAYGVYRQGGGVGGAGQGGAAGLGTAGVGLGTTAGGLGIVGGGGGGFAVQAPAGGGVGGVGGGGSGGMGLAARLAEGMEGRLV
ncbi:hypothetical protein JCM8547_000469 [Rhodosporidiobolus lusitaniae]